MHSISFDKASKTYSRAPRPALNQLSLHVDSGEVYGFLGANGAGKSTAIRLLLNFIQPTQGKAYIMGKDAVKNSAETKKYIGYLAGDVALWPKVTGNEIFRYLGDIQGDINQNYLRKLVTRFEAEPDKAIGELSKGNKQKIGIIQAFMHRPKVLILDEPTTGLDPIMQERFYETVREAATDGAAIFVSSHNLPEVQRMCDRVGIIRKGVLVHEAVVKPSKTSSQSITMHVQLAHLKDVAKLRVNKSLELLEVRGTQVVIRPKKTIADALAVLSTCTILSLKTEEIGVEDEFLAYYEDGK